MIALIMAGGSGTRFWPLSRKSKPKQFLQIRGEQSMLQLTVQRLLGRIEIQDIYIVTAASQVALVREHLPLLPAENIIIEPFGMNTAPCIGLSLAYLKTRIAGDESIVVLPADHVILDTEGFLDSLQKAEKPAAEGNLVTFGIVPDYPATGYGYIEAGASEGVYEVVRFKEKPDLETAQGFLAQGNFYWNSGMFYWKLDTIWGAYQAHLPAVVSLLDEIMLIWKEQGTAAEIGALYARMPRTPVDIGIMEPAASRAVIPVNYGWNDVGSWKALADITPADQAGNSISGKNFVIDSYGNFVSSHKFVSLIGVQNLCIIETDDAILITTKDKSEDVKKVVDNLSSLKHEELL